MTTTARILALSATHNVTLSPINLSCLAHWLDTRDVPHAMGLVHGLKLPVAFVKAYRKMAGLRR